jgi:hypothetical protein
MDAIFDLVPVPSETALTPALGSGAAAGTLEPGYAGSVRTSAAGRGSGDHDGSAWARLGFSRAVASTAS